MGKVLTAAATRGLESPKYRTLRARNEKLWVRLLQHREYVKVLIAAGFEIRQSAQTSQVTAFNSNDKPPMDIKAQAEIKHLQSEIESLLDRTEPRESNPKLLDSLLHRLHTLRLNNGNVRESKRVDYPDPDTKYTRVQERKNLNGRDTTNYLGSERTDAKMTRGAYSKANEYAQLSTRYSSSSSTCPRGVNPSIVTREMELVHPGREGHDGSDGMALRDLHDVLDTVAASVQQLRQ